MALSNVFKKETTEKLVERIEKLKATTPAQWGKMNASQMLAHCNVTYELVYENKHPKPNFIMKLILKAFVKKIVTNEVPYKRSSQTAPAFIITDSRDFEPEKKRLVDYLHKTQQLGESHFDNKESISFGLMNITEWNNMFYKHLDHHLMQFGV